jgi:TRAP-type C4-dicarboxylate transport system permease small subunit
MEKIDKVLNSVMRAIMAFAMLVLVVGGFWQVFSRFVLSNPSTFTDELLRYMLIWSGLIGSAYCFYKNEHLSLGLVKDRLQGKAKITLTIFNEVVILAFVFYIYIFGGMKLVSVNIAQLSSVLRISMGLIYAVLPISGVFIIFGKIIQYAMMFKKYKEKQNGGTQL